MEEQEIKCSDWDSKDTTARCQVPELTAPRSRRE